MNNDAFGLIFAYQDDNVMKSLTQKRALSSIPFGGRYRIVDFILSNMVNSGITKVGIITRNNYQSLMDHLGSGKEWDLSRKNGGLYMLPPFFSQGTAYRGKLEALRNAESFIRKSSQEYVIMANADSIANIDLDAALEYHKSKGADITMMYKKQAFKPAEEDVGQNCVIKTQEDGRVIDIAMDPAPSDEIVNLSMGVMIMQRSLLETLILECSSHNMYSLHRDVLQRRINDLKIYGFEYSGYFQKIDSISSYFATNMDLLNTDIREQLFGTNRQIYTKIRDEAPTIYRGQSSVKNSLVADGCVIEGTVENSIIFRGVHIHKGAVIRNSIIMQDTEVQEDSELNYVITDKDVVIRESRKLFGYNLYPMVLAKGSVV